MNKMFTPFQREELAALVDIRIDTLNADPESADEFESVEGNLTRLKQKIEAGSWDLTVAETNWLIEEVEFRVQCCKDNKSRAGLKTFNNVLAKLLNYI